MKLTSKGQVTVPVSLRRAAGIGPCDEVQWSEHPKGLLLSKADPDKAGSAIIARMRRGGRVKGSTAHWLRLTRGGG